MFKTIRHLTSPLIEHDMNEKQSEVEKQTELMHHGDTIWTAVFNADHDAINRFIDADPNLINVRGAVGECPIHMLFLCGTDKHFKIARDLILKFPDIVTQIYNKPKYYGENILHIAIVKRDPTMVEWLLKTEELKSYRQPLLRATATGDFFKRDKPTYYGETPLGFACCTEQWNMVEILLKYGADMDATDSYGNNILHVLAIRTLPDMYTKFKARWIENQAMNKDMTPQKSESVTPILLWNRVNNDGLTPLTLAADFRRTKMLSWLLQERKVTQWSYGNVTCVLHPLDQLDIGFIEDKRRPLSVLEVMIKNNDPELVDSIIVSLIDKKWSHFAYRVLLRRFFIAFVYLLIFLATTILEQTRPELKTNSDGETVVINTLYSDFIRMMITSIGRMIVLSGALWKTTIEITEMRVLGFRNYMKSTGSIFLENCLACSFCFCIFTVQIFRFLDIKYYPIILAITSLLGWGYMFFFIMPFRFTGPFVIMIYKMLFNDVLRFCIIYVIFLTGFSQAFFILFNENGLFGYFSSIKRCFLGLLGDFDLEHYIGGEYPLTSLIMFIFYVVVITILLLNLLIAMMGDTYADVKKSAKKLWHLERARIALDIESGLPKQKRQLSRNKYWVDVKGERYLQVEQVIDSRLEAHNNQTSDED